mgnify:CR=1 FL=1
MLYETFDNCSGIGGNDGIWDGDNVGLADFFPDNDGWSGTPKTGANKCALLGNATRKANAVTPSFKISEPVVISFLAAPYTGSSDNKLILLQTMVATPCLMSQSSLSFLVSGQR